MNQTVELVNKWGEFEKKYPNGNVEDFCRHYLAHQKQKKIKGTLVGGVVPSFNEAIDENNRQNKQTEYNYANIAQRD
jgi:hypothetical protein